MKKFYASIWSEALLVRRSKIFRIMIIAFTFIPVMLGLMMWVQINPEFSDKVGLIGTKAEMLNLGEPGWSSYFGLITQTISALGMLGIGLVISWVFGREYSDNTIKDILALPVSRSTIVCAKYLISAAWSAILALVFIGSAVIMGFVFNLPGYSSEILVHGILNFAMIVFLTLLVSTPVAFFASYGRGFLVPVGFVIFILIMANFTGLAGVGPYFPWAIPGIYGVSAQVAGMHLNYFSYLLLFITFLAGFAGTMAWWRFADQQ